MSTKKDSTPAQTASSADLKLIRHELNFIGREVQNREIDFEALDEIGRSVQNALAALESHELSLLPEVEDEARAA